MKNFTVIWFFTPPGWILNETCQNCSVTSNGPHPRGRNFFWILMSCCVWTVLLHKHVCLSACLPLWLHVVARQVVKRSILYDRWIWLQRESEKRQQCSSQWINNFAKRNRRKKMGVSNEMESCKPRSFVFEYSVLMELLKMLFLCYPHFVLQIFQRSVEICRLRRWDVGTNECL